MANPSGAKSPRWHYASADSDPPPRRKKRGLFTAPRDANGRLKTGKKRRKS